MNIGYTCFGSILGSNKYRRGERKNLNRLTVRQTDTDERTDGKMDGWTGRGRGRGNRGRQTQTNRHRQTDTNRQTDRQTRPDRQNQNWMTAGIKTRCPSQHASVHQIMPMYTTSSNCTPDIANVKTDHVQTCTRSCKFAHLQFLK